VGIDESKLVQLRQSIEKDIEGGLSDGSIVLVARRGRIVMHEAIGFSDKRNGRKVQTDDVLPVMSLTKQLTAATLFRFIDRGQVTLTTRIAEIIPEFGQKGKERVTIRDAESSGRFTDAAPGGRLAQRQRSLRCKNLSVTPRAGA